MKFVFHKCEECGEPEYDKYCYRCRELRNKRVEEKPYYQGVYNTIDSSWQPMGFYTMSGRSYSKTRIKEELRGFSKRELLEIFADLIG
jgi:hypothetical protein